MPFLIKSEFLRTLLKYFTLYIAMQIEFHRLLMLARALVCLCLSRRDVKASASVCVCVIQVGSRDLVGTEEANIEKNEIKMNIFQRAVENL